VLFAAFSPPVPDPRFPADLPNAPFDMAKYVNPPVIDRWGPGTRVPTIVISPFARKGLVDHAQYDTTAILKLIEERWNLQPLTDRDANAGDLLTAQSSGAVARRMHRKAKFKDSGRQRMLRMIIGITLGFVGGYLYGSERARDEARRRLASAPEPVRQATERISGVISGAPVPSAVKQAATRATAVVQTATERAANASAPASRVAHPSPAEVGGRPDEPLPRYEPESPTG